MPASPGHPRFFPSVNGSPSLYRSGWSPFMMHPVLTRRTSVQESSAASASRVRDGMSMAAVAHAKPRARVEALAGALSWRAPIRLPAGHHGLFLFSSGEREQW